jgi:hypothetical protein
MYPWLHPIKRIEQSTAPAVIAITILVEYSEGWRVGD